MHLKISRFLSAAAIVFAAAGPEAAVADDDYPVAAVVQEGAVNLQPSTPWNLNFADENCRLSRLFGEGDNKHLLFFEQAAPSSTFSMTIAGPAFAKFKRRERIELGMPSDQRFLRTIRPRLVDVETIGSGLIYTSINLSDFGEDNPANEETDDDARVTIRAAIDLDAAAKVERIVARSGKRVVSLETGEMASAFQALNTCTRDLLRVWGLDPAKFADADYTPAKAIDLMKISKRIQRTYPKSALRRGQQAFFRMRMIVEADGSVSECYLDRATKSESFDSPACKEFMRAKFEPALDANGLPMRSFYSTTVTYILG